MFIKWNLVRPAPILCTASTELCPLGLPCTGSLRLRERFLINSCTTCCTVPQRVHVHTEDYIIIILWPAMRRQVATLAKESETEVINLDIMPQPEGFRAITPTCCTINLSCLLRLILILPCAELPHVVLTYSDINHCCLPASGVVLLKFCSTF